MNTPAPPDDYPAEAVRLVREGCTLLARVTGNLSVVTPTRRSWDKQATVRTTRDRRAPVP
jgi:hypothetical protein